VQYTIQQHLVCFSSQRLYNDAMTNMHQNKSLSIIQKKKVSLRRVKRGVRRRRHHHHNHNHNHNHNHRHRRRRRRRRRRHHHHHHISFMDWAIC